MTGPPLLSVVIPAYNSGESLAVQLDAVARQGSAAVRGAWEVIVADNGSTDDTVAVANGFAHRLPIRVVDASARRGPAVARNVGGRGAQGSVLVFTDADDRVLDGWLDRWFRWASKVEGHQIAAGPVLRAATGHRAMNAPGAGCTPPSHMGVPYASGNNLGVSASLFLALGGFDEDRWTGEDVDLSWRAVDAGFELSCVPAYVQVESGRSGFRLVRRYFEYGIGDVQLFRDYRHRLRLDRSGLISTARSYLGLVMRVPMLWDDEQRRRWCHQLGRRMGRLTGSLRFRTWLP